VDDDLLGENGIFSLLQREGRIFKYGSGRKYFLKSRRNLDGTLLFFACQGFSGLGFFQAGRGAFKRFPKWARLICRIVNAL
jgi:hypothetical protein